MEEDISITKTVEMEAMLIGGFWGGFYASTMFVHTSAFKAQAGIGVIEGKIMTQQHLMEEAPK